jgi:hypothetical protein
MDGTSIPPVLIYQATTGNIQDSWIDELDPDEPDTAHFTSTTSGWTNDEMALAWMSSVFDRYTKKKARNGRDWRLLFIDGHGSHVNLRFIDWCLQHCILLAVYPPHSTHRLQPLDVGLFSPLGKYYSKELDDWMHRCGGLSRFTKREFYGLFKAAYRKAFSKENILSAWEKTGLQPLDPELILGVVSSKAAERPSTSGSISSTSTVYSASNVREVRRLVKRVVGPTASRDADKLGDFVERMAASNSILTARIQGLEEAIKAEKRKRRRGKAVIPNIRTVTEGKATIWSPQKLAISKQVIKTAEDAEEQEKKDKAVEKVRKKKEKEEKEQLTRQRQQQKKKDKEENLTQKMASLQLTNNLKMYATTPKNARRGSPSKKKKVVVIDSDGDESYEESDAEVVVEPLRRD